MIDALVGVLPGARERWSALESQLALPMRFVLVTMHRPANVDDPEILAEILSGLLTLSEEVLPVVFPVHPRTRSRMEEFGLVRTKGGWVKFLEPLGFVDFLALTSASKLVVTDSGGSRRNRPFSAPPASQSGPIRNALSL